MKKEQKELTSAQWAKRYRALVAQQRKLPPDKQWTMGALLREAKANFIVAAEYEKLGIR